MKKIKILHVLSKLDRGGAEMSTLRFLTRNHAQLNCEFHFWLTSGQIGTLDSDFIAVSNGGKIIYRRLNVKSLLSFFRYLKDENIDTIHSHIFLTSGIFMLLGWLAGVKERISHLRSSSDGNSMSIQRKIQTSILKLFCLLFSTKILSVSQSAATKVFGDEILDNRKFQVVYNGFKINEQSQQGEIRQYFTIGHVGRFHKAKNHEFIARIILALFDSPNLDKKFRFVLCGMEDDIIAPGFRSMLGHLIKDGKVILKGVTKDVNLELANIDLFLFPSRWEGLPGALLEALASGVPALASNIDPVLEIEQFFSQLHTRSINAPAKDWADEIVRISRLNLWASKDQLINEFKVSPFYYENSDDIYKKVYDVTHNK